MKNFIFAFLSLITFTIGYSQNPPPVLFTTPNNAAYFDDLVAENNKFGRVVYANQRNDSAFKNLYLFDDTQGFIDIYTKDGKGFKVPNANFELMKQQLEVILDDGNIFTFDTSSIDYFVKNNKKYVFVDNVTRPLHEELMKTDKVILLKGYKIIKKEAMTNPLTNEVTKPAFYAKDEVYFLSIDSKVLEIPNRFNKFLNLFDDKSAEIKKYVNANDLSIDEDVDLKKIISYYNTL